MKLADELTRRPASDFDIEHVEDDEPHIEMVRLTVQVKKQLFLVFFLKSIALRLYVY